MKHEEAFHIFIHIFFTFVIFVILIIYLYCLLYCLLDCLFVCLFVCQCVHMMFMYTALCLRKIARCPSNFPPLHADAASNSALNLYIYIYKMHAQETTEPLQLETGYWQLRQTLCQELQESNARGVQVTSGHCIYL